MLVKDLYEIARILGGNLSRGHGDVLVSSVSTDTRTLSPGDLFFALKGERFDGQEYVRQAEAMGAGGAVVSSDMKMDNADFPIIRVDDTLLALRILAQWERTQCKGTVLAITGSNGKSTTRSMIHSVLSSKYKVVSAEKSFNNQIGVSLTLLRNQPDTNCMVLELGTNHPGEIEDLCGLCSPNMALITNIGQSHLEFFQDEEGILQEKMTLARCESVEHCFYNANDPLLCKAFAPLEQPYTSFGTTQKAEVRAMELCLTEGWKTFVKLDSGNHFELSIPGVHQGLNALAAVAVGRKMKVDDPSIATQLNGWKGLPRRSEVKIAFGIWVIDDTYNANPTSFLAALEALAMAPRGIGKTFLVMGRMAELGDQEISHHHDIGHLCASNGVECLVTVGESPRAAALAAKEDGVESLSFPDTQNALKAVLSMLQPGDAVWVKGSRTSRMDAFVDQLMENLSKLRGVKACSID